MYVRRTYIYFELNVRLIKTGGFQVRRADDREARKGWSCQRTFLWNHKGKMERLIKKG